MIRDTLKLYTIESSNKALPLVKRIVNDIQNTYKEFKQIELSGAGTDIFDKKKEELFNLVEELNTLGVELKDFEQGLVDFYHKMDGKLVYLCWKADEDKISHWHTLESGFSGRQSL